MNYSDFSIFKFQSISWKALLLWLFLFLGTYYIVPYLASFVEVTQNQSHNNVLILKYLYTTRIYWLLFSGIVLVPIMEEMLFSGLIMTNYFKHSPYFFDIILSASLFSLWHIIGYHWSWIEFLLYFVMGALFSMIYRTGRSIYYPIFFHIVWNLIGDFPVILYVMNL